MKKIIDLYNKKPWLFLVLGSILLGFLTALFANQVSSIIYTISPSYSYVNDQNMFFYMGKLLMMGKTPYIDFFDHKGPYIFYYTGLGNLLGGRFGMIIVQTITFSIFYLFFIKTLELYEVNQRIITASLFLLMAVIIASGQSPSDFEIALPLIMISIYFYLLAVKKDDDKYFLFGNILTGITAGVAIHLRATDAMISLGMVIYFGVRQLINKRYPNLIINALVCLGGLVLASLPPLIHSLAGGFTSLMYEACIISNFKYVSSVSSDLEYKWISRVIILVISALVTFVSVINHKKNRIDINETLFYAITLGVALAIQFAIALYAHYLMILVPILFVFFARITSLYKVNKKVVITAEVGSITLSILAASIFPVINYNINFEKDNKINEFIQTTIDIEDRDEETLCYQTSSSYYLNNDIVVGYADFSVQKNHMPISSVYTYDAIKEYVTSDRCKYVIIDNDYEGDNFTSWLKNESGLNPINSTLEGAKYITIYKK